MSFTITLTPKAGQKMLETMKQEENGDLGKIVGNVVAGIRIDVLPGGCSGFQYSMGVAIGINDDDTVVESEGVKLIVNKFSKMYLDNLIIDYVETLMGSGYTFSNPNSPNTCGCGSSFSV